ncbi:MAG: hypothetical protein HYU77_11685 [Betaproteobacteria bacterium]|nr:hypothetical protein [Betaproteobacteria bacterium]
MLAALVVAYSAQAAEALPDPTRPPPGVAVPGPTPGIGAAPAGPVLQSVYLSATRRAAIIDGQVVELGGKLGDARLIKVSESEAVLKGPEGMQTLRLFPSVEKRALTPEPAKGARAGVRERRTSKGATKETK